MALSKEELLCCVLSCAQQRLARQEAAVLCLHGNEAEAPCEAAVPEQQLKPCLDAACLPAGGGGSSGCPDGGSGGGEHGTGAAADAG